MSPQQPPLESARRVDGSVGIAGYRKDLSEPVARGTDAIIRLWTDHGITAVRVDGSTWEELALLRGLLSTRHPESEVVVLGGGPTLVDTVPASEREYWVLGRDAAKAAVETAVAHRGGWVDVRMVDTDAAEMTISAAHRAGLRVSFRGQWSAVRHLGAGDHVPAVVDALAKPGSSRAETLARWATDFELGAARLVELAESGVSLGSGLLALRRSIFLREAIEAPFLEELEPILPHAVYLREMKRMGGYLAGRRQLRQHAGLSEPSKDTLAAADDGWLALLAALPPVVDSLVPASCAPQLTSVPGYSWHEECAILRHAGIVNPGESSSTVLLSENISY